MNEFENAVVAASPFCLFKAAGNFNMRQMYLQL